MTQLLWLKIGLALFGMLAILTLRQYGVVLFLIVDMVAVVYVTRNNQYAYSAENPLGALLGISVFGVFFLALATCQIFYHLVNFDTTFNLAQAFESAVLIPQETQFSALLKALSGTPVLDIPFYNTYSMDGETIRKLLLADPQKYLAKYMSYISFALWFPLLSVLLLSMKATLVNSLVLSGDLFTRVFVCTVIALILALLLPSQTHITTPEKYLGTVFSNWYFGWYFGLPFLWTLFCCVNFSLPVLLHSWRYK